jgi:UDP-N-acetylglucosamine 1-carboxyvinyltransferase
MDKIIVKGNSQLQGRVEVSGAKNAALPILFATLLTENKVIFNKLPKLQDIKSTLNLLEMLGVTIASDQEVTSVCAKEVKNLVADYDVVRKMRASILVLGPLLARYHQAQVSLPGGCAIGARPVDLHLSGMEALGAAITIESGYVKAECKGGLKGAHIDLDFPSVGATENIMMAACLAEGETIIEMRQRSQRSLILEIFLIQLALKSLVMELVSLRYEVKKKLAAAKRKFLIK